MRSSRCLTFLPAALALLLSLGCGGSSSNSPTQSDFALSVGPQNVFVPIGVGNGGLQVSIQAINNYNQSVSVSFSGLPDGISASPGLPVSISPGSKQTVTLTAPAGVSPSLGTITVTGTSGTLTHTTSFSLSVASPSYAYLATGNPGNPPYNLVGITADANTGSIATIPGTPISLTKMPLDYATASESGGAFLYVLVPIDSQTMSLISYSVNAATGALVPLQTINFPPNTQQTQLVLHPSGTYLYVLQANCLQAYSIDPATGNLTDASCTAGAGGPTTSFVVPAPGNFAYEIAQNPDNSTGWSIYQVRPSDGSLLFLNTSLAAVGGSLFSDPQARALYVLSPATDSGGCGSFSAWQMDPSSGAVTNLNTTFSPLCVPASMTFNSADTLAYVSSGGGQNNQQDGIYGATLDSTTGVPNLISGSPFASGISAGFGAVEPSQGKFLLEQESKDGQVVVFAIDQTSGALTQVAGASINLPSKLVYAEKMVTVSPAK